MSSLAKSIVKAVVDSAPAELRDARRAVCAKCEHNVSRRMTPLSDPEPTCDRCGCPVETLTASLRHPEILEGRASGRRVQTRCKAPGGSKWAAAGLSIALVMALCGDVSAQGFNENLVETRTEITDVDSLAIWVFTDGDFYRYTGEAVVEFLGGLGGGVTYAQLDSLAGELDARDSVLAGAQVAQFARIELADTAAVLRLLIPGGAGEIAEESFGDVQTALDTAFARIARGLSGGGGTPPDGVASRLDFVGRTFVLDRTQGLADLTVEIPGDGSPGLADTASALRVYAIVAADSARARAERYADANDDDTQLTQAEVRTFARGELADTAAAIRASFPTAQDLSAYVERPELVDSVSAIRADFPEPDGTGTDDQQLGITGYTVTLEDGGQAVIPPPTVERIPSLPASRVTSGTFATARIPNLAASKITSGTLADARIPATVTRDTEVAELSRPQLADTATVLRALIPDPVDLTGYVDRPELSDSTLAIRSDFPVDTDTQRSDAEILAATQSRLDDSTAAIRADLPPDPDLTVYVQRPELSDSAAAIRADFPDATAPPQLLQLFGSELAISEGNDVDLPTDARTLGGQQPTHYLDRESHFGQIDASVVGSGVLDPDRLGPGNPENAYLTSDGWVSLADDFPKHFFGDLDTLAAGTTVYAQTPAYSGVAGPKPANGFVETTRDDQTLVIRQELQSATSERLYARTRIPPAQFGPFIEVGARFAGSPTDELQTLDQVAERGASTDVSLTLGGTSNVIGQELHVSVDMANISSGDTVWLGRINHGAFSASIIAMVDARNTGLTEVISLYDGDLRRLTRTRNSLVNASGLEFVYDLQSGTQTIVGVVNAGGNDFLPRVKLIARGTNDVPTWEPGVAGDAFAVPASVVVDLTQFDAPEPRSDQEIRDVIAAVGYSTGPHTVDTDDQTASQVPTAAGSNVEAQLGKRIPAAPTGGPRFFNAFYSGDLDALETGFVYAGGSATNKPGDGTNGFIRTLRFNDDIAIQWYRTFSGSATYERTQSAGTWGAWGPPPGDDLGDHTATQTLDMGGNRIDFTPEVILRNSTNNRFLTIDDNEFLFEELVGGQVAVVDIRIDAPDGRVAVGRNPVGIFDNYGYMEVTDILATPLSGGTVDVPLYVSDVIVSSSGAGGNIRLNNQFGTGGDQKVTVVNTGSGNVTVVQSDNTAIVNVPQGQHRTILRVRNQSTYYSY